MYRQAKTAPLAKTVKLLAALAGLKVYASSFGPDRDGPQGTPAGTQAIVRAEPNPFAGQCRISLAPGLRSAEVTVHDVSGRVVRTLAGNAGAVVWDGLNSEGRNLPAGVYYARVSAGTVSSCVKLVKR